MHNLVSMQAADPRGTASQVICASGNHLIPSPIYISHSTGRVFLESTLPAYV